MTTNKKIFEIISSDKKREWMTSSEAAEYLRIAVGTLRNMVCNGVLKPRGKVGRLNRFHIDDLINFLTKK